MFKKLFFCAFLLTGLFAKSSFEINLNDKDIELKALIDLQKFGYGGFESKYYIESGYISSSSKKDNDEMFSTGFLLRSYVQAIKNLEAYMGLKFVVQQWGSKNSLALPIGMWFKYSFPFVKTNVSLKGSLYYAPEPLSFSDANAYREARVEAAFEIIKNGEIYFGYRNIIADYDQIDNSFNESIFVGIRIKLTRF